MTEDEMVGWHPQRDGHVFEEAPGVGDGQGNLVCCSPWGHKELDTTEQLNRTLKVNMLVAQSCPALSWTVASAFSRDVESIH